jgi:single-strand DNA-binding protein
MRFTASEMAVASFSVAVTARRKAADGSWENGDTSFFDVTAFGRLAENIGDSVTKGQRVIVSGTLKQSSWEKDGQKRSKIEIVADEVGPSLKWDPIVQGEVSIPARKPKFVDEEPF